MDFEIQVSMDGEHFSPVVTRTGMTGVSLTQIYTFEPVEARFVRLYATKLQEFSGLGYVLQLSEFQVWGEMAADKENVALHKSVVDYSSTYEASDSNDSINHLTDGRYDNSYASGLFRNDSPNSVEYVTLYLEGTYRIDRATLVPHPGKTCFPVDYEIQVSMDGLDFATVVAKTGVTGVTAPQTHYFDPVEARFVRLYATKLQEYPGLGYLLQLGELEVYGEKTGNTDPDEPIRPEKTYLDIMDNIVIEAYCAIDHVEILNQEQFDLMGKADVDMALLTTAGVAGVTSPMSVLRGLEYARNAGVMMLVSDDRMMTTNMLDLTPEQVKSYFGLYTGQDGMAGYYLKDEPW